MKIPIKLGKLKKCSKCATNKNYCKSPIKFEFNFYTLKFDCYWVEEWAHDNGKVSHRYYFKNFGYHCDNGPAENWYSDNGEIENEWYYKNGIEMSEEEYYENPN